MNIKLTDRSEPPTAFDRSEPATASLTGTISTDIPQSRELHEEDREALKVFASQLRDAWRADPALRVFIGWRDGTARVHPGALPTNEQLARNHCVAIDNALGGLVRMAPFVLVNLDDPNAF
jgi:hypothetical protein